MKDRLGKNSLTVKRLGLEESLPNHKEEKVRHLTEVQSNQSSQRLWLCNGRWEVGLICLSHRVFLGYLLVLIREFVFSTDDCIIISDSKSPRSLEKESRLHILTNQAGNDVRDNRSFAICYEVCPEAPKPCWRTCSSGPFPLPSLILPRWGRHALAATKILGRKPVFSGFAFCPRDLFLRRVSNSSLQYQTGWSLVLVVGN